MNGLTIYPAAPSRTASEAEFVELYNSGTSQLDLSGWSLSDATKARHVFPANTVLGPHGILVVFGGGNPQITTSPWQTASTGSLNLNNSAETVSLFNSLNTLIEQKIYGPEGGFDQSLVRWPEGEGELFVQHASIPEAQGAKYSAGYLINPPLPPTAAVPELPTLNYFLSLLFLLPFWHKIS